MSTCVLTSFPHTYKSTSKNYRQRRPTVTSPHITFIYTKMLQLIAPQSPQPAGTYSVLCLVQKRPLCNRFVTTDDDYSSSRDHRHRVSNAYGSKSDGPVESAIQTLSLTSSATPARKGCQKPQRLFVLRFLTTAVSSKRIPASDFQSRPFIVANCARRRKSAP